MSDTMPVESFIRPGDLIIAESTWFRWSYFVVSKPYGPIEMMSVPVYAHLLTKQGVRRDWIESMTGSVEINQLLGGGDYVITLHTRANGERVR